MTHKTAINSTADFNGRGVFIEREEVSIQKIHGTCLDLSEAGVLVKYKYRGRWRVDMIPWSYVRTMTAEEPRKLRRADLAGATPVIRELEEGIHVGLEEEDTEEGTRLEEEEIESVEGEV